MKPTPTTAAVPRSSGSSSRPIGFRRRRRRLIFSSSGSEPLAGLAASGRERLARQARDVEVRDEDAHAEDHACGHEILHQRVPAAPTAPAVFLGHGLSFFSFFWKRNRYWEP